MLHYRSCNLCEAICGLTVETEGNRVIAIRGDRDDPFSRGYLCPKAVGLKDIYEDPDRLRRPLRRTPTGWAEISWKDALAEVADRLGAIQLAHGNDAVALYRGNPSVHNSGTILGAADFARALRTRHAYSATSVDQLPHHFAALLQFGHQLLLPVPDLDRTDFLLVLGGNPLVSNGSLMTAPDVRRRLRAIQDRGGRLVVVDPARTRTAELADDHLAVRPGTDVFLLLGLLKQLFAEGLVRPGRLAGFTDGLAALETFLAPFALPELAAACGIEPERIVALARAFAAADAAVAYGRMGVSTQAHGGHCQWLVNVLNIVTGNLDRPGGAMFTTPAIDVLARTSRGRRGRWRSRVRGLAEFGGELPVSTLAEDILAGADRPDGIRALVTIAGNPLLSTPNGAQLERALQTLDFRVAVDIYLNETTRHADIILPPTTGLETEHYDLVFNLLAIRNVAKYSAPAVAPHPDARHDHEIFRALTAGLLARKGKDSWRKRLARRFLPPRRQLDLGLRLGPHRLSLAKLRRRPHGLDLGPLEPRLPARLFTPDRRIQLAPAPYLEAGPELLAAARRAAAPRSPDSFSLIGRRNLRSNNSWMHNVPRLVRNNPCTLLMHPADAAALGLEEGREVTVTSRVGAVRLPLEISDGIAAGVVSIPHGWGHGRPATRLSVANAHAGVNVNLLTDDGRVDPLTGNAVLNGVPVTVA